MRISDAAKRVHERYNLHRVADPIGSVGKWFAANLADGVSTDDLYDSKREAVRHQHHDEWFYWFIQVGPWPMDELMAETGLDVQRRARKAGLGQADRDHDGGGIDVIRRTNAEDQKSQIRALFGRGGNAVAGLLLPGMPGYHL